MLTQSDRLTQTARHDPAPFINKLEIFTRPKNCLLELYSLTVKNYFRYKNLHITAVNPIY